VIALPAGTGRGQSRFQVKATAPKAIAGKTFKPYESQLTG